MGEKRSPRRLVKAIDTNVVLRWLMEDDPTQTADAQSAFAQPVWISLTVLIETAWVLRSRYRFSAADAADLLSRVVEVQQVAVADPELVEWAIGRLRVGADFADMAHLVAARRMEAFVTFDRSIVKAAGLDGPLPVETLRG